MTRVQPPVQFTIRPVPPFRLDLTVWALRRRSRNLVDRWDGVIYRRVVVLRERAMELAVRQTGTPTAPRLNVTVTPTPRSETDKWQLRRLLDRLLGVRIDLSA
jgi:DNA-3-methyladenine glycosylase II